MNQILILPEHINCEGCRVDGVKTYFCENLCEVRQCARERKVKTCGDCPEMETCPKVGEILSNSQEARDNLMK